MHVNYLYMLSKARGNSEQGGPVVLDYGCGSGEVIQEARNTGLTVYGAETFYEGGGNRRAQIEERGLLGTVVREIENGVIPFEDNFFDLVISNQVFEHVEDLDAVLHEIHRVLKPEGILLSLFPGKETIREGHCGLPFIHWFSKHSRFRFYYALTLRRLGLGYRKGNKSASQWTSNFLEYLDAFTHYRDRKTIFDSFQTQWSMSLVESDYITFRLNRDGRTFLSRLFSFPFVQPLGCAVFRRLGGFVISARKTSSSSSAMRQGAGS